MQIKQENLINYFIVAYAFVLPISKAATVLFATLAIITWVISANYSAKLRLISSSPLIVSVFALVALSGIAIAWSPDTEFWLKFMHKYWHFLIIPVIFTSIKERFIRHAFTAFLFGMLISEIVAFGIFFEIWSLKGVSPSNPSPFMDHVNYGIYLAFTALILLNRIFFDKRSIARLAYAAYFLVVTANLFIIAGRTGQVAFLLGLIVIGLLNIRNKLVAIGAMVLLGAAITVTAYNVSDTFQVRVHQASQEVHRMIEYRDFHGSLSQRIALWVMGTHVFLENPILGTGIGNETSGVIKYVQRYNFTPYYNIEENTYIDYHNAFVQYAAQLGIIGLALFIAIFIFQLRLKFKSTIYRNLNITFVTLYALLSTVGFSFHLMNSMVLFALFAGLFAAISRIESLDNRNITN